MWRDQARDSMQQQSCSFRRRACARVYRFERGATLMGIQPIVFPPETLDKTEDLLDVAGYLAQWADFMVVRHPGIGVLEQLAAAEALPVVNAMTSVNHPCEVLSDLYALSRDADIAQLRFLFVDAAGNVAGAWGEAAQALGLGCCRAQCLRRLRIQALSHARSAGRDGPGADGLRCFPCAGMWWSSASTSHFSRSLSERSETKRVRITVLVRTGRRRGTRSSGFYPRFVY